MKERIRAAILNYMANKDSPLANIVEHVLGLPITSNIALIGDEVFSLLKEGIVIVSGICPHGDLRRGLDIRIRRASDFKGIPGSAC